MRNLLGYWRGFLFIYSRPSQYFCSIPFPADLSQATTLDDKCQLWSCLTTIIENYEVEVWPRQRKGTLTPPNLSIVSDWDLLTNATDLLDLGWSGVGRVAACYCSLPEFSFLLSLSLVRTVIEIQQRMRNPLEVVPCKSNYTILYKRTVLQLDSGSHHWAINYLRLRVPKNANGQIVIGRDEQKSPHNLTPSPTTVHVLILA